MAVARSDALVLFGASGDLAHKKIIPALYAMCRRGHLDVPIVGVAKSGWSVDDLRSHARDALKTVAEGVNHLRSPERSFVVITHYQRLLDYIVPDYVHVLVGGKIVRSGGKELALELEEKGYVHIAPGSLEKVAQ